jgi:hypothetical protein
MNNYFGQQPYLLKSARRIHITSEGEIEKMHSFECYPNVQY